MRIKYLDSLRGLAALSVVIHHFIGGFGVPGGVPEWFMRSPLAFMTDGIAAVALFFVLSGFVLTYRSFATGSYAIGQSLGPFLINRVLRIFPPFMAWVVISAICLRYLAPLAGSVTRPSAAWALQSEWLRAIWAEPVGLSRILREFVLITPPSGIHLIPQDWSLTYEFNISLFIPLYLLLAFAGTGPLLFYTLLRSLKNIFLLHFLFGILIAKNFSKIQETLKQKSAVFRVGVFSVGLSLFTWRETIGPALAQRLPNHSEEVGWILAGIGSGLIIIVSLGSEKFQSLLNHRFFVWMGKISYSLYLMHMVILKCVSPLVIAWSAPVLGEGFARWVGLGVTVAVSLILSHFSYLAFEEPPIRLGKWITSKWAWRPIWPFDFAKPDRPPISAEGFMK